MLNRMRGRCATALAAGTLLAAAPAAQAKHHRAPTRSQIRTAVTRATRSSALWATVNICDTKRHPDVIGIRGQMPALGFRAALSMRIQVDYRSAGHWKPDPGAREGVELGSPRSGSQQGGVTFRFSPPAVLSGTITFEWRLGNRVIGRATRSTAGGQRGVDAGDPRGFSSASCKIS